MKRKISLVILSSLFLGFLATVSPVVLAQGGLEITYPKLLPFMNPPTTTRTFLPDYFKYWMDVALVIAGLIAFSSLLLAGFSYLTSSGNPSQLQDSKDQAISAFLGMAILFASYSFFQTINPQLTVFKRPGLSVTNFGVYLYEDTAVDPSTGKVIGIGTKDHILSSQADLTGRVNAANQPLAYKGIEFARDPITGLIPGDLEVTLYSEKGGGGRQCTLINDPTTSIASLCTGANSVLPIKSLSLKMRLDGVYLFKDIDYGGKSAYFDRTVSDLGEFNDWASSIKIMGGFPTGNVRAILHENKGFEGKCSLLYGDDQNLNNSTGDNNVFGANSVRSDEASSLTVFKNQSTLVGPGVTFYSKTKYGGTPWGPYAYADAAHPEAGWSLSLTSGSSPLQDTVSSLKIDGQYLVAFFTGYNFTGNCEVFTKSNEDLFAHTIGKCIKLQCWCIIPGVCFPCPTSCVRSIIVYPAQRIN